ncbi:MAG: hypothetical protein HXK70_03255 [Clostridiales bacterium]|nr:hypothetical protein [Clostridiales bacterium]
MSKNEHEEFLSPREIREMYGLQEDEDLYKFVKEVNNKSKGSRIVIINQEGDKNEN